MESGRKINRILNISTCLLKFPFSKKVVNLFSRILFQFFSNAGSLNFVWALTHLQHDWMSILEKGENENERSQQKVSKKVHFKETAKLVVFGSKI
jgi:hypothetical protein